MKGFIIYFVDARGNHDHAIVGSWLEYAYFRFVLRFTNCKNVTVTPWF